MKTLKCIHLMNDYQSPEQKEVWRGLMWVECLHVKALNYIQIVTRTTLQRYVLVLSETRLSIQSAAVTRLGVFVHEW